VWGSRLWCEKHRELNKVGKGGGGAGEEEVDTR